MSFSRAVSAAKVAGAKFGAWYDKQLTANPIVTKAATSAALYVVGDSMAQAIAGGEGGVDLGRLARGIVWGGLFGVMAHGWYGVLEKIVMAQGRTGAVLRVAWDQLTWTPLVNIAFFMTGATLSTGSPAAGLAEAQDKLWPTLKVNWIVWPVLQAVNFTMVPVPYRVLYINIASIFWAAYLSTVLNSPAQAADEATR